MVLIKRNLLIVGIIFLFISLLLGSFVITRMGWFDSGKEVVEYELEGKKYRFYTARTPEQWGQGLMDVRDLGDVDGMMFFFPNAQACSMWNKNTYLDLDVYWIRDGKVLGKSFLPALQPDKPIETVSAPGQCDIAIEKDAHR